MARRCCRWGTLLIVMVGAAMPLREACARLHPGVHEGSSVSGIVQSASTAQLVLIPDQARSAAPQTAMKLTFVVRPETQLLWGAQTLAAAELQRGDTVMVRYHEQAGTKVAQMIWALMAHARETSPAETAEAGAEAAYAQARRLIDAGRLLDALPYLGRAIRLQPGYLAAYGRRGYVFATLAMMEGEDAAQQSYRQRALADYTTAIEEGMKHGLMAAVWHNNRGVLYRQLEDNERSLADFTAALHIEPSYVSALQNRANLRRTLGDSEGALEDLTQVITLEPEVGKWYCQRGLLLRQQGRDGGAQADFQRCLSLDPDLRERYPEATDRLRNEPHG
jgi:tetratricopeptide (TPR) repeat protein